MSKANDECLPVVLDLFGPDEYRTKMDYWFYRENVGIERIADRVRNPFFPNTECLIYNAWPTAKIPVFGYKAFHKTKDGELFCRAKKYEVGKTYEENVFPIMCIQGMHFCNTLINIFNYYPMDADTKIARVKATGLVVTDNVHVKFCTDRLVILEEIPWEKAAHILNEELAYWMRRRNTYVIDDGMDFVFSSPLKYAIHHSFEKDLLKFINDDF